MATVNANEEMIKVNLSLPVAVWNQVKARSGRGGYSKFVANAIWSQVRHARHVSAKQKLSALLGKVEINDDHPWADLEAMDKLLESER